MKIILTALVAAVLATIVWNQYDDYQMRQQALLMQQRMINEPASDWFVVRNLAVADGYTGDDLPAVYDREIRKPFAGRWYAEIKNAETQESACYGNGAAIYEPKDVLPKAGVTLGWIMQKTCKLVPGQYYLEINYTVLPTNYPQKDYRAVSNVFTIREKDDGQAG